MTIRKVADDRYRLQTMLRVTSWEIKSGSQGSQRRLTSIDG